jgi:PAS domain S-box-containing protein
MTHCLENLHLLFEQASDLVQVTSPDGVILYVNPAWCRVLGYDAAQVVGLPMGQLLDSVEGDRYHHLCATLQVQSSPTSATVPPSPIQLILRTQTGKRISAAGQMICQMAEDRSPQILSLWRVLLSPSEPDILPIQERYSLVARDARAGVWAWHVPTGKFYLDPNIKALLGYTDGEIPNDLHLWLTYVHPDDLEALVAAVRAHLDGETPACVFEHRMLHKDGSIHWILVQGAARRNAQGAVGWMVGTDTDITSRKLAELEVKQLNTQFKVQLQQRNAELTQAYLALEEGQQQIAAMAANIPGSVFRAIIHADHSISLPFINSTSQELTGIDPVTAKANPRLLIDLVHPDDQATVRNSLNRAIATGQDLQHDFRIVLPQGIVKWVRQSARLTLLPNGDRVLDGILLDNTPNKQIAMALAASEASLREAHRIARLGNWELDVQNQQVTWSDGLLAMFGFAPGDPDPSALQHFYYIHPRDRRRLRIYVNQVIREAAPDEIDLRILKTDGTIGYVAVRGIALRNALGKVTKLVGTVLDITERKQAATEVLKALKRERELNEMKSRFVSIVSHEFRTPLTVIQSATDLLEMETENREDYPEYYRQIHGAIAQMIALLDNALLIGKDVRVGKDS